MHTRTVEAAFLHRRHDLVFAAYGGISLLLGGFTVWTIFRFDKPLIRAKEEVNEREHEVSATLFPQQPEISENTVRYKVTLGLPFDEADASTACAVAHCTGVIDELPRGLESNIQQKGVNGSGGQKQRLALARGILYGGAKRLGAAR